MKLESMHISYNKYTFENDGVPANSHGGKAYFTTENGKLEVQLSPSVVAAIVKLVAPVVVAACQEMGNTNSRDVENSVSQNLLPHDGVEDAEFTVPEGSF